MQKRFLFLKTSSHFFSKSTTPISFELFAKMLHIIYTIYLFKKTKNSIELSKVNDVGVPLFLLWIVKKKLF